MARDQLTGPSLDQITAQRLTDFAPAAVGLLGAIDHRQHALMTGWGGPFTARFCGLLSTGSYTVPYRVPPGVDWVQVVSLLAGDTKVVYTTMADAQGTTVRSITEFVTASGGGAWDRVSEVVSGPPPTNADTADTSPARALKVATASWDWQDVDVTIAVSSYTGGTVGGLLMYGFNPWRVRQ